MDTVLLLFLASGMVAAIDPPFQPKIDWVDCHENVPPVLLTTFPALDPSTTTPLPSLLCGHVHVPVDYAKPMHANNTITLNLAMHRPQNPKGVLF